MSVPPAFFILMNALGVFVWFINIWHWKELSKKEKLGMIALGFWLAFYWIGLYYLGWTFTWRLG